VSVEVRIGWALKSTIFLTACLIHGAWFRANIAIDPAALPACVTLYIGEG